MMDERCGIWHKWRCLTKGNHACTVVQVAANDLIILAAFVPIVEFLLGISDISVPWSTPFLSVLLFVVIQLTGGVLARMALIKKKGTDCFQNKFLPKSGNTTAIGLLLTLVILFAFQSETIINNPIHILLIAIPLAIQTFLIFFISYGACKKMRLTHDIAAPAGMIGASNFFELSVAVAIAVFGADSPVVTATAVGVLAEVPTMLLPVRIANRTKHRFPA